MLMYRLTTTLMVAALVGCSPDKGYLPSETSRAIYSELEANDFESINLSKFGGESWSKVCFLGPYNELSEKTLGFSWHVSDYTEVLKSDGHNVIVFATDSEVIEYVVHSRRSGDFWQLSGECYNRSNSIFIKDPEGKFGRNYISKKA